MTLKARYRRLRKYLIADMRIYGACRRWLPVGATIKLVSVSEARQLLRNADRLMRFAGGKNE